MALISETERTGRVTTARNSMRLRKILNLQSQPDDPIQRPCKAFAPGTCVRPHRHLAVRKCELNELTPGPHRAVGDRDFGSWAPEKSTLQAKIFINWFGQA